MCFNPRTRAGCDVIGQLVGKMVDEFQSTHPCRVRHLKHLTIIILLKFQSTHPCRVRREAWIDWFSQHMFQSTHPCRVRQTSIARTIGIKLVSIHAPVQGATVKGDACDTLRKSFNPRTRAGCDFIIRGLKCSVIVFQSTHPCRVRRSLSTSSSESSMFQSTHPCRVRPSGTRAPKKIFVSIHAPVQGATPRLMLYFRMENSFNPRTRAGCDYRYCFPCGCPGGFNPRTRAGCDTANSNCLIF